MRDVIFIPGLGKDNSQLVFLRLKPLWRLYGIRLHVYLINWEDGSGLADKYQGLKDLAASCPNLIGVVGASAGASAGVMLLSDGLIKRLVTVCGLLDNSIVNRSGMKRRSPVFLAAIDETTRRLRADPNLAAGILTIRPLDDKVVYPRVATTPGAHDRRVWTRGHALSIFYILIFKIRLIKRFLKT